MAGTNIPVGSALARKIYGAALFANMQREPSLSNNLTGSAPKQSDAEAKLKGQTDAGMPIVRITDLSKSQGDRVTVDLINQTGGKPIMGDRMAEGKGERLDLSTMEIRIDLATKVVDSGGKMSQQRTVHNLRGLAMANLKGWYRRYNDQASLVHMAGARGVQGGTDWVVPQTNDPDFNEIMINPVLAPTYTRHFVADGSSVSQGGSKLAAIASTDIFTLDHVDAMATIIDDMEFRLQPIRIADDPAANDEPLYLLMVTNRQWNSILTSTSTTNNWRTFLQNAWNRKSYGSKHPLFSGEAGIWHNILIRKIDRSIRFNPGTKVQSCLEAGQNTAAEVPVTVNESLTPGFAVDRAILLGAQALGNAYGKNQSSDTYASWLENKYNFERNTEVAGEVMGGRAKLRFAVPDEYGNKRPIDHGVMVLDTAVNLNN